MRGPKVWQIEVVGLEPFDEFEAPNMAEAEEIAGLLIRARLAELGERPGIVQATFLCLEQVGVHFQQTTGLFVVPWWGAGRGAR